MSSEITRVVRIVLLQPGKTIQSGIQRILSTQSVRNDIQERVEGNPHDSLLFILSNHRYTEAENPRDKYFALAGLVKENEAIVSAQSYANSVGAAYTLSAQSITIDQENGALNFLDCAGWPTTAPTQGHNFDLPSWAPDWSCTEARAIPLLYWQFASNFALSALEDQSIIPIDAPGSYTSSIPGSFSIWRDERRLLALGLTFNVLRDVGFSQWSDNQISPRFASNVQQKHPTGESLSDVVWNTFVLDHAVPDGRKAPSEWGAIFYQLLRPPSHPPSNLSSYSQPWYQQNRHLKICGKTLEEIVQEEVQRQESKPDMISTMSDSLNHFEAAFVTVAGFRRLATTEKGYLCYAPCKAEPGDVIAILADCHAPVVLRRQPEGHCRFVGTCYVHGIMHREGVKTLNLRQRLSEEFDIR
jgi:hypothetical protein